MLGESFPLPCSLMLVHHGAKAQDTICSIVDETISLVVDVVDVVDDTDFGGLKSKTALAYLGHNQSV